MKSTARYTPGPWVIDNEPDGAPDYTPALRIFTDEKVSACVAIVSTWHKDDDQSAQIEARANARLIAAAPDLFKIVAEIARLDRNSMISAEIIKAAQEAVARTVASAE